MSRWLITVGLAATVTLAGVTRADADPSRDPALASPAGSSATPARTSGQKPARKPASKTSKGTSKSAAKTVRKPARKASRRVAIAKARGDNMPRGFTWPPSQAMTAAEAVCKQDLSAAEVAWQPAAPEGHITAAVTIDDGMLGGIAYRPVFGKGPYKLDCQLALALQAIGPELRAAGVREVRFGSIYRWSNVRVGGKTKNVLSRHALGLAMDVVSFVDADGREAKVARDYASGDPLLLEVEQRIDASSSFRLVLTPKNDPISHKDHFHIEANPSYAASSR